MVDRKGKKTINVRTTASEKNRITATLCCTASGKMLPPFVVFKGKTKRGIKKVPVPHGVVCTTQAKGWMDEERMLEWIQKVWAPYVDGNRALLSLDTFSGHLTDRVKDALDKCGTKMLVIPGGCTSVLQPLDVSINKPFKAYIRQSWCECMVSEAETGVAKITPASKAILMEWIKTAADLVEKNPIRSRNHLKSQGSLISQIAPEVMLCSRRFRMFWMKCLGKVMWSLLETPLLTPNQIVNQMSQRMQVIKFQVIRFSSRTSLNVTLMTQNLLTLKLLTLKMHQTRD